MYVLPWLLIVELGGVVNESRMSVCIYLDIHDDVTDDELLIELDELINSDETCMSGDTLSYAIVGIYLFC